MASPVPDRAALGVRRPDAAFHCGGAADGGRDGVSGRELLVMDDLGGWQSRGLAAA